VVFYKNNPAKNKTLFASKPVAFERYTKYPSNKIDSIQLGLWITRCGFSSGKDTLY
jgi:hypothetical protein